MAQSFKEKAHLNTDRKAYSEGWDRIFGKKNDEKEEKITEKEVEESDDCCCGQRWCSNCQ